MVTTWKLGRPKKSASKNVKVGWPAERIINLCGGVSEVSRETGIAPSTIFSWMKSGLIPQKRHAVISALSSEKGHKLTDADFEAPQ